MPPRNVQSPIEQSSRLRPRAWWSISGELSSHLHFANTPQITLRQVSNDFSISGVGMQAADIRRLREFKRLPNSAGDLINALYRCGLHVGTRFQRHSPPPFGPALFPLSCRKTSECQDRFGFGRSLPPPPRAV